MCAHFRRVDHWPLSMLRNWYWTSPARREMALLCLAHRGAGTVDETRADGPGQSQVAPDEPSLAGLQHRHAGHRLDHLERLYSDEFRSHLGLAIFEEHCDHLFKVFA